MPTARQNYQDAPAAIKSPMALPHTSSHKLVVKTGDDQILIFSRKAGGGAIDGVQMEFGKNRDDFSDSLNGSKEFWRLLQVQNLKGRGAYAYQQTATATGNTGTLGGTLSGSGSWATTEIGTSQIDPTAPTGEKIVAMSTATSGDAKEFTIVVPDTGKFNVAFCYSGAGGEAEISIAGVQLGELVPLTLPSGATSRLLVKEYTTTPGTRVVRVRHTGGGTGGKNLYLIGVNLSSLAHVPYHSGQVFSAYATGRDNNAYINTDGANDYAFYDKDANLWGGSAHGGETAASAARFFFDDVETTLTNGVPIACRKIKIIQKTVVDWSGSGGGTLNLTTTHLIVDGLVHRMTQMTGSARLGVCYTHMCGPTTSFTDMIFPKQQTFAAVAQKNIVTPRSSEVWQQNPTTGQIVAQQFTLFDGETSDFVEGGGHVQYTASQYYKYRYGLCASDDTSKYEKRVTQLAFQSTIAFL